MKPDLEVEEVRVAMALNGGVSLAVWMGGCAVEIDCARRADLGPEEIEGAPTRRVYAAICEALGRRLVVDVMSGASAGGINGALLAAAGVARRRLHPGYLRSRWIELGDLGALLHPLSNADPRSLMDGGYFHEQLLRTFEEVLWPDRERPDPEPRNQPPYEPPALVPPPALDVTTTNVAGEDRRFRDVWGGELTALEYRARFRFRAEADYAAGTLADAARSSASFPLAFEPWKVEDPAALALAGFAEPRSVIDGGLLDNAPIAAAIDLIKARRTNRLVKRYLCYVNGEPKDVTARPSEPDFAPRLPAVLANVLGLPRKAPFADQLRALDDVSWRGAPTLEAELQLLALDIAALEQTAAALLGIYRDRRRMVSLRETLVQPDLARRAWERVADPSHPLELPWVPLSIEPPSQGRWGWGVQAARRVHHLMLDMLRASIPLAQPGGVEALLAARMEIDARVAESERRRSAVGGDERVQALLAELSEGGDPEPVLMRLAEHWAPGEVELRDEVVATAQTVFDVSNQIGALGGVPVGEALFGPDWATAGELTDAMVDHFLRRVLSVEVVRRAFAMERDIEDGQRIAFAQLTPLAPSPLFDAAPLSAPRPQSPEAKLCGIRLAHFSAFHRRSWRANDFMWGRMDAAARVVAMLLDTGRATELAEREPWVTLADAVLPLAPTDAERLLVDEALADAGHPRPPGALEDDDELRDRLLAALAQDLSGDGRLARVLCIRAAQLEVLADELPVLVAEAAGDARLGASTGPLDLPVERERLGEAIEAIRGGEPLPDRLGRDAGAEAVSNLALATVSRSGLVTLALLRGSGLPLMGPLQTLRALFLSIAGMVTRSAVHRVAVVAAVFAAALLLTARALTVDPDEVADLGRMSFAGLLLGLIALLVVAAVAAVPIMRALERKTADRWVHGAVGALIVLAGGIGATAVGLLAVGLSPAQAIVARGFEPSSAVAWAPVALVLGYSTIKAPLIGKRLPPVFRKPWVPWLGLVLVALGSVLVAVWSIDRLRDASQPGGWVDVAAWAPLAALAVGALYVFAQGLLLRAGRRRAARA